MRSFFICCSLIACRLASGQSTVVEFKVTGEIYKGLESVELDLAQYNQLLKTKNLPLIPETISFALNDDEKWKKLMTQLSLIKKLMKTEIDLVFNRSYFYEFQNLCYRGKTHEVPKVIESLMGNVLHGDQGIQAMRYKDRKLIYQKGAFFETNRAITRQVMQRNPQEVRLWQNHEPHSETLIILSDFGSTHEGGELTATEIKRCKDPIL